MVLGLQSLLVRDGHSVQQSQLEERRTLYGTGYPPSEAPTAIECQSTCHVSPPALKKLAADVKLVKCPELMSLSSGMLDDWHMRTCHPNGPKCRGSTRAVPVMKALSMGHLMSLAPVIDWISDLGKIIMRVANPRGSTLYSVSSMPLPRFHCIFTIVHFLTLIDPCHDQGIGTRMRFQSCEFAVVSGNTSMSYRESR